MFSGPEYDVKIQYCKPVPKHIWQPMSEFAQGTFAQQTVCLPAVYQRGPRFRKAGVKYDESQTKKFISLNA